MGEIAILREKIAARKYRSAELAEEIDRKVRDIKEILSGHSLTRPENLRLGMVAEISAQLEKLQEEYLTLQKEIKTAEKDLA